MLTYVLINRADFADINVAMVEDAWTYTGGAPSSAKHVSPGGEKFLGALLNVLARGDVVIRDGRRCATMDNWRRECVTLGLIDVEAKEHSARTLFAKHRRDLVTANRIACNDDVAWEI
jgi:hypothetical protein